MKGGNVDCRTRFYKRGYLYNSRIIDITYAKADLKQVDNNSTHLNSEEITQILGILKDFEHLFNSTSEDWDTKPVNLELKPGYKPFNSKYCPFPIINEEIFRKDLKSLVKIVVLTLVHQIQYSTPVFIITKGKGTVRFITDHCRLNQKLVRTPYLLPRIVNTMQKMEGFHYATVLYLNIRYYTIRISPSSQDTRR